MARQEHPREDLIRDAVALVDRIEFLGSSQSPIVVGFRRDGSVNFYFGEQPVYHFNAQHELRRAHLDGIIKAEQRRLVRLNRRRADGEVQLLRQQLAATEQREFLEAARAGLIALRNQIENGQIIAGRQVSSSDSGVLSRVRQWLAAMPDQIGVAEHL